MEFMSNLGSTDDIYRPTLFELISQDKMRELLHPAVRYVLVVYAQRYPRYLLRLVNRYEEFYALMMIFVERHYLKEWGASFAENFYGLKRIRSLRRSKNLRETASHAELEKLKDADIWPSVLVLVGLPYVKTKLDNLYERLSGGAGARLLGASALRDDDSFWNNDVSRMDRMRRFARWLFKRCYPWISAAYHVASWGYSVAYLAEQTRYYTPWLHFLGIEIRRMSLQDFREYDDLRKQHRSSTVARTRPELGFRILSTILTEGIEFLKVLLPMSIFFFKFLEWWYSSEYARRAGGDGVQVPPPEKIQPDPRGLPVPLAGMCPICKGPLTNPTALPSGYVFCYTCAFQHVSAYGFCPVTLLKVGEDEMRKVYNMAS